MRFLFAMVLAAVLLVSVPGVRAAATIADIYSAPSEAERYTGASLTNCQFADLACNDTNYPTVTDVYGALGDGSTSASSGVSIRNSTNAQTAYIRFVYDVDGVLSGNYSLRFFSTGTTGFNGVVCEYRSDIAVNVSSCKFFSTVVGENWNEVDITSLVSSQATTYNGRITLRMYSLGSSAETISEIYLKRPAKPGDFQIVPQGVTTGDVNQWLENEWLIISQANIPLSSPSCAIHPVSAYNATLNASITLMNVSLSEANKKLRVRWFANSTLVGPGENYEVECSVLAGTTQLSGIEQYVYMTVDGGIFADLEEVLYTVLRTLGLVERPVELRQITMQVPPQGPVNLLMQATYGEQLYANATCNATVTAYNGSVLYNNVSMQNQNNGLYNFSFANDGLAPYGTRITCLVNDSTNVWRTYRTTGTILSGVSEIYEGIPEMVVLQTQFFSGRSSQVMVQVRKGSNNVNNAVCSLNVFYPNGTKAVNGSSMSYFGEDGLYNYTWTPSYVEGNYPMTIVCSGGSLGALSTKSADSFYVRDGTRMEALS